MTVDGYAENFIELSQQITNLINGVHSHIDGSLSGIQSSIQGSIEGLDNSISGLNDALSGSVNGLHEHLSNLVIGSNNEPAPLIFTHSLNGADGSYADGTLVTVVGRDGAFKVLASRNFYNDSKDSQNMLIYLLERTDLEHKPTMLVADIYVKKVVTL